MNNTKSKTNGRWLPVEAAGIPAELKEQPQWVCWAFEPRKAGQSPTKIPYTPDGGRRAKANDPTTWGRFDGALSTYSARRQRWDGIGFEFAGDGGLVGVDLDDCRDPLTGTIAPWAFEAIERFGTYTEISPSSTGFKLWAKGKLPGDGTGKRQPYQTGTVEMYASGRFFAATGHRLESAPATVNEAQEAIEWLWSNVGFSVNEPSDQLHLSTQSAQSAMSALCTPSALSTLSYSVSSARAEKNGEDETFSEAIEAAIQRTLPNGTKQRNRLTFELARHLKAIPSLSDAPAKSRDLQRIVRRWHKLALPKIGTKPFDDTLADFLKSWRSVKYPVGQGPIKLAFERAKVVEPPAAALEFERPEVRLLIALCRELQRIAGRDPFYLTCRAAGELLAIPHTTAWRWLEMLCNCEILRVEEIGDYAKHRASRYRYLALEGHGDS